MDVITLGETMVAFTPATNGLLRYARNFSAKYAGAESNVAIALSRLGHHVGWISKIGDDEFGKGLLSFIRGEGVDVSQVVTDPEYPTGLYFKELLHPDDVRVHYYRKYSAASTLTPEDLNEDYFAKAAYLHLTGITPALSESCYQTVHKSIELAKKHGVKTIFDPNLRKKLWSEEKARKVLVEIASMADIVLPGISEGQFLFGKKETKEIADAFLKIGASIVVIKLGEKGAYFAASEESGFIPGFPVKQVIDPVGAGDGFAGGFISGLLDGLSLSEAVKRGCAIGAMVTSVHGDVEGLPDRRLLEQFINKRDEDDVQR